MEENEEEQQIKKHTAVTPIGQLQKTIKIDKLRTPESIMNEPLKRNQLYSQAKRSIVGKVIVDTYPDMSWDDFDAEKYLHIRNAFLIWLNSKTTVEVYTMMELNNLLAFMKSEVMRRMQRKVAAQQDLDKFDWERLDKMFEHITNLHKLKHGEKKVIANIDFRVLRDMGKNKTEILKEDESYT